VVEETKRTRVIPEQADTSDKPWRLLDVWEYLASLTPDQYARENVVAYLYRYDSNGNLYACEDGKFNGPVDQFKIGDLYGGGRFNIKVKRGPQLIKNEDFQIEGPAKSLSNGRPGSTSPAAPGSEGALLTTINALVEELRAARGGTTLQDSLKNAMALNASIFSAAIPVVTSTLQNVTGGHTAPARDPLVEELLKAAVAKMLNPPAANSLEETLKLIQLFKGSGLLQGTDSKTSMALELVRQVPNVAHTLVQGVEHWRFAEEARARQAAIMRTGPQPINVPPAAPAPPANVISMPPPTPQTDAAAAPGAPTNTQADAAAVAAQEQQPPAAMPIEVLEQLICNIIVDPNLTLEQAATEACALIERVLPGQTDTMVANGKENLMLFFRSRPILAQVANHPRLAEFLDKFIETIKAAPVMQAPNPTAPVA
jgi:hypothetical protein